jgi:nitrite reductase/ring-hydroxylating ferredoxin subunit
MKPAIVVPRRNLEPGRVLAVEAEGRSIAICEINGRVCAVRNSCTHEDWALTDGYVVKGQIVCSLHGASFDLATGECTRGPADAPVQVYEARLQGDEIVVLVPDAAEAEAA